MVCPSWAVTFLCAVGTTAPACQILPVTSNADVLAFIADPCERTAASLLGVYSIGKLADYLVVSCLGDGAANTLAAFTALLRVMLQVHPALSGHTLLCGGVAVCS